MRIPKLFKPSFKFGVSGVPGVPDTISAIENNKLNPILADTLTEWPGVSGVPDTDSVDAPRRAGTPDTPDHAAGVSTLSTDNLLNNQEELNTDTPGTPDTPENSLCRKLLPDTGPIPGGLNEVEARLWRAIAAEPGLSRVQLCERTCVTLEEFDANTPVLCGRQLAWPDYVRYGGWMTARQAKEAQS
jgi:hypothetical protein